MSPVSPGRIVAEPRLVRKPGARLGHDPGRAVGRREGGGGGGRGYGPGFDRKLLMRVSPSFPRFCTHFYQVPAWEHTSSEAPASCSRSHDPGRQADWKTGGNSHCMAL